MKEGVQSKTEFVIPSVKGKEVRELTGHIADLFNVEVSYLSDSSSSAAKNEWVTVLGTKLQSENAKKYIIAFCNPEREVYIKVPRQYVDKLIGTDKEFLNKLEKEFSTFVKFVPSLGIYVKGTIVAVTQVQSYIEDQISICSESTSNLSGEALKTVKGCFVNDSLREFGRRLGFNDTQIEAAALKCGPTVNENSLLQELLIYIRTRDGVPSSVLSSSVESMTYNTCGFEDQSDSKTIAECSSSPGQDSPVVDSSEDLRHIVVDGSNVAMCHGNKEVFSCKGIQICVDWFRNRGHKNITVFVPQWRKEVSKTDSPIFDQEILLQLEKERVLVFTPSRRVNGRRVVCYDDRYIVKVAADEDGIIVSNDHFRDLEKESPEYKQVIDQRLLMYSFVNDRFMPPDDPLGRHGPSLDNFLKKGTPLHPRLCPYGRRCTYGQKCRYYHPEKQGVSQKKCDIGQRVQVQLRADSEDKKESDVHSQNMQTLIHKSTNPKKEIEQKHYQVVTNTRHISEKCCETGYISDGFKMPDKAKVFLPCGIEAKEPAKSDLSASLDDIVARGKEPVLSTQKLCHSKEPVTDPNNPLKQPSESKKHTNKTMPLLTNGQHPVSHCNVGQFNGRTQQQLNPVSGKGYTEQVPSPVLPRRGIPYRQESLPFRQQIDAVDKYRENWNSREVYMMPVQGTFQQQQQQPLDSRYTDLAFVNNQLMGPFVQLPQSSHLSYYDGFHMSPYPKLIDPEYQRQFALPVQHCTGKVDLLHELQARFPGQNDRILHVLRQHPNEGDVNVLSWLILNAPL